MTGDLWSGSEGGAIKIWPWEAIETSLSLPTEQRPKAALLVERSFIDPRTQLPPNAFGNVLNSDVKYLLSDNSRAKVWTAGYLSFALWYACIFPNIPFFPNIHCIVFSCYYVAGMLVQGSYLKFSIQMVSLKIEWTSHPYRKRDHKIPLASFSARGML